jgi:lipid A 3-O-deacylase
MNVIDGLGQLVLIGLFGGFGFGDDGGPSRNAFELQSFAPTKSERPLDLVNASWYFSRRTLFDERLELSLGATVSRATGNIVQTSGKIEDGTFRAQTLESAAWGIGPTVAASTVLARGSTASLSLDAAGSLMVYDRSFPAGGSRYNGMVQIGPTLAWQGSRAGEWRVGVRWVHVSNGQGLGAHNPSYDGKGVSLRYERSLRGMLRS